MADYLNIAGRVRTTASDGVAMEAQEVKDLNLNKSQQEVNADVQTELGDRYTKEETYNRDQLNELITTPDVNRVYVIATNLTTAVTDLLPATGSSDTLYNVGNWDGTQYDTTVYSIYGWNGTAYVCLAVRSSIGEVYDISANHPDGQGNPTPYADLTAALGTGGANVPVGIRRGGMSIKFIQGTVQSSDNKYVQARCMAQNFTTDVTQWQGVDDIPTAGSTNLVESGGVEDVLNFNFKKDSGNRTVYLHIKQGQHVLFYNNDTEPVRLLLRVTQNGSNIVNFGRVNAKSYYEYTAETDTFYLRIELDAPSITTIDLWCIKDQSLIGVVKYIRNLTLATNVSSNSVNLILKTNDGSEIIINTLALPMASTLKAGMMSASDKSFVYNMSNNIVSEIGDSDDKLMTQNGITKALNELYVESTKQFTGSTASNDLYLPIRKGDVVNIELSTNFATGLRYYIYYRNLNGQTGDNSDLIDNPSIPVLNNRIYSFVANRDALGLRFRYTNVPEITTDNPFNVTIKLSRKSVENGVLGYVKTNKEVLFPVRRDLIYFQEENELYIIYRNPSNAYGGLHRVHYVKNNGDIRNIASVYGRIGYYKELLVNSIPPSEYNKYIIITNPNAIEMELTFLSPQVYNQKYPRVPYPVFNLGEGRMVISPYTSKYCHGAYILLGTAFTYIAFHSNQIRTLENTNDYQNSVYLTILEDGIREVVTKTIFSDHDYIETYNNNELLCPYNHSYIDIENNSILATCGFRNGSELIWMYKTFNKDTWELSAIAPQKLSYNGNVVDWTLKNFIDMINTLYGFSYDDTFAPITAGGTLKMFKYNDVYYTISATRVQEGSVDTVTSPFILMSSTNGIVWSPVAKLLDGQLMSETAIAIHDNKLFVIFRPGHNSLKYAVFSMTDYSIVKAVTVIPDSMTSMPVAFVYNDMIYTIYNKNPSGVMPLDNYYGRTCISLSCLNGNNELVELKKYYNAAGFQYFDVAIRGNIVRFVNTEDNGGYNVDFGGPYCQCTVCDIKNEDLVIPSN